MLTPVTPSGVSTAFLYNTQVGGGEGYSGIISAPPPNVNTPIFYEPQPSLSQNKLVLWIVVSGPPPNFGGAQVWSSVDGTTYGQLGSVGAGGVEGVLTAMFPSGSDPDTTNTLSVDVSESGGTITPGADIDADLGITLAIVDSELIGYSTATLTSTYNYNLDTYIRRGQFGTSIASHSIGAPFGLINGSVFKYEYPQNLIGQTVYFKFPSFNTVGGGLQDISTVAVYTYTLTGVGLLPPGAFTLDPVTTGTSHTVSLTSPMEITYWTSVTSGSKTTSLPGAGAGNKGYLWIEKLTQGDGSTHTITPTSGTIDFQSSFTFTDVPGVVTASVDMISDGVSNWMIVG